MGSHTKQVVKPSVIKDVTFKTLDIVIGNEKL